jgi:uncharacterized protein (DUF427 family)
LLRPVVQFVAIAAPAPSKGFVWIAKLCGKDALSAAVRRKKSGFEPMKQPGPDHPITISQDGTRVRVLFAGRTVADTTRALILKEAHYHSVYYIPRADADMALLTRTTHATHCPYKGDASYFTISAEGRTAENAVWSYETPYPAVAGIKEHLAFYPNRVDEIKVG